MRGKLLVVATLCSVCWLAAPAGATPLSNTAVTQSEIAGFFAINGPGLVEMADGNVTVPLGGGTTNLHLNTRVWEGTAGTAAEGLFLYDYWLEGETNVREFLLNFGPVVPFDMNGDATLETSWYCSNCTTSPVPIPPDASDLTGDALTFFFDSGFDPFTSHFYAISDVGPSELTAHVKVLETGETTYPLAALSPVPEPGTFGLLGSALAALALSGRRASRRP